MKAMNEELRSFAPDFHPNSRIWIYQANRPLLPDEVNGINQRLNAFTRSWTAHNQALKADGRVLFDRFIVLAVDNSFAEASGCSIDKSTHFLQEVEKDLGLNLFDRLKIAYLKEEGGEIDIISKPELRSALEEGTVHAETPVFNNTIQSLEELKNSWIRPLRETWAGQVLKRT